MTAILDYCVFTKTLCLLPLSCLLPFFLVLPAVLWENRASLLPLWWKGVFSWGKSLEVDSCSGNMTSTLCHSTVHTNEKLPNYSSGMISCLYSEVMEMISKLQCEHQILTSLIFISIRECENQVTYEGVQCNMANCQQQHFKPHTAGAILYFQLFTKNSKLFYKWWILPNYRWCQSMVLTDRPNTYKRWI